jgi:hypothetical protein
MKTRLGTAIVSILAILGGIAGFLGTFGYISFLDASKAFAAGCQVLRTGEARGLITKAQRAEIAKFVVPAGSGDQELAAYFTSDCSKSLLQFGAAQARR